MISVNGIVGLSLLVGALKRDLAVFNPEGTGAALATVIALAGLCLVLPRFTTTEAGPVFSPGQLTFAAIASLVALRPVRLHPDGAAPRLLPARRGLDESGRGPVDEDGDGHADPPSDRTALVSLGLLLVALVSTVGLAKVESPAIEDGVDALGFPQSFVGVVIALLVLLPETIAAVRAASRARVQTSLNLALGSAMASIGLTIPTLALASIWLDGPLALGLGTVQMVLLLLTVLVAVLTVVPGRAKPLQGGVHLVLLSAFVFLSISP